MDNAKAVEELERLKRFIQDLQENLDDIDPGDFCVGLYNWSGDSVEALDLAIEKINTG